jgi:hypothetical protein
MSGLVTADFQWEFDGLLLGAGTPYGVTSAPGLLDLSGVRANFTPRARAHGGFSEPHFGGGAVLDVEFDISATSSSTFTAAVLALEAATYPQAGTRPFWWRIPGHPLLTMAVQCLRRSIPLETAYAFGLVSKAALQFYAPDPLKYGASLSATTGLPTTSGGLVYPLAYPLAYGSPVTGRVSCSNAGSAPTAPTFTVTGPIDAAGWQVTSIEDGVTATYTGPLGSLDSVVYTPSNGRAALNVTADRSNLLSSTTYPFPPIPAGSTRTYAFTTVGTYQAAASMAVAWSPAYW